MVGFYLFNVALLEFCCGLSHILKGEKTSMISNTKVTVNAFCKKLVLLQKVLLNIAYRCSELN